MSFDTMTKPQLLTYLEEEHGLRLPEKTTKAELLQVLSEREGELTNVGHTATAAGEEKREPKAAIIQIAEDGDEAKNYVDVYANGRCYQIKKATDVRVPMIVVNVLKDAIQKQYKSVLQENGKRVLKEMTKLRFPFHVVEYIY